MKKKGKNKMQQESLTESLEEQIDYKKMYFTLLAATEDALELIIRAQQQCEALYTSAPTAEQLPPKKES